MAIQYLHFNSVLLALYMLFIFICHAVQYLSVFTAMHGFFCNLLSNNSHHSKVTPHKHIWLRVDLLIKQKLAVLNVLLFILLKTGEKRSHQHLPLLIQHTQYPSNRNKIHQFLISLYIKISNSLQSNSAYEVCHWLYRRKVSFFPPLCQWSSAVE